MTMPTSMMVRSIPIRTTITTIIPTLINMSMTMPIAVMAAPTGTSTTPRGVPLIITTIPDMSTSPTSISTRSR